MAVTSPDNLRTPDAGDQYALVQDLGALADTVQNALNRRANTFQGTGAQRAAQASSATDGMLWQDTDGIGMLWKFAASAWTPAVRRWVGTIAQMNAFTQAPVGFEWLDSSSNRTYFRYSGAWRMHFLSGRSGPFPAIAANSVATLTADISFANFQSDPIAVCSLAVGTSRNLDLRVSSLSPTSLTFRIGNYSPTDLPAGQYVHFTASIAS